MDGLTGLEVQRALQQNPRRVPVIFLSGHGTIPTATAGMKRGAEDFLEKPFRPDDLLAAIERAIEHDRVQSADRIEREQLRRLHATLTPREQEVMELVVTGLLNKQAAAELGISEKTVKVHRARVMEKMRAESLAALVHLAERIGLGLSEELPEPAASVD
jgi:RNA polymerase sigma factor (sigma-70 family)